jgi:hypothetical protein
MGSTVQELTVDVPLEGRFRVTFWPAKKTTDGWGTRWFWIPHKAEPL